MADYRAYLSNFSMMGDSWTEGRKWRWRNRMKLRLGQVNCELVQGREVMRTPKHEEKGGFVHTTDLIIRDVPKKKLPHARSVAADVASLLSFASLSGVWAFGENYPDGTRNTKVSASRGAWNYFRPTIDTMDSAVLRTYLENAWTPFRTNKRLHKLPEMFDYLVIAEQPGTVVELQLAIVFLVLESLKFSYARSAGIPFAKGRFRNVGAKARSPSRAPPWSFEDLLQQMFASQGMRPSFRTVVRARNELIHTGLFGKPGRVRFRYYERAHDLVREYLLRLLQFKGRYQSYRMAVRQM